MTTLNYSMLPFDQGLIQSIGEAYIVGGSTRDLLLGQPPVDYDIAVRGNPEKFARAVGRHMGRRCVPLGKPGKMVYRIVRGETIVDITPLRGPTIESDLALRDFTINAMAYDLASGRLVDPLGGRQDLAARSVRMVTEDAFPEDPLRLLRAFRMAAGLAFTLAEGTVSAIARHADEIRHSAGERIRDELFKIFGTPHSHRHLLLMHDTGLLVAVFPELAPMQGCHQNRHHSHDVFVHTMKAYGQLERLISSHAADTPGGRSPQAVGHRLTSGRALDGKKLAALKFALLLHDMGKPASKTVDAGGDVHFYGHEKAGEKLAATVCDRIRCSREEHRFITSILSLHSRPLQLYNLYKKGALSNKAVIRLFMAVGDDIPYLLLHAAADMNGKGEASHGNCLAFTNFLEHLSAQYTWDYLPNKEHPPLLTGQDLIREFGLSPSPLFKKILHQVEETRLSEKQFDRSSALSYVGRYLETMKKSPP